MATPDLIRTSGRMPEQPKAVLELDVVDMLSVGHSIRALARQLKAPPGTADTYARVGAEMVAAAHAAIAKQGPVKP